MPKEFAQALIEIFHNQKSKVVQACNDNLIDEDYVNECFAGMDSQLSDIQNYLDRIDSAEKENKILSKQLKDLQSMKEEHEKCRSILENAGVEIIEDTSKKVEKPTSEKVSSDGDVISATKKEENEHHLFYPIGDEEFSKVPNYMKGRLTVGILNEILIQLESLLKKKDTLMRKKMSAMAVHDKNHVIRWREDINKLGKKAIDNPIFCSEVEFRAELPDKLKLAVIKGMQVLRHLKRVTETKVAGKNYIFPVL